MLTTATHPLQITNAPDLRLDVAALEPLVHRCIDDSRRLFNASDATSTTVLKEIAIRLASRYQCLFERSRKLHASVSHDRAWATFQFLDRKLRKKVTALMHLISQ